MAQHQQSSSLLFARDLILPNVEDVVNFIAQVVIFEAMTTDPSQYQSINEPSSAP